MLVLEGVLCVNSVWRVVPSFTLLKRPSFSVSPSCFSFDVRAARGRMANIIIIIPGTVNTTRY